MDRSYKITNVQKRKEWTGNYGPMQDYALQLDGVDGWVQKTQKPDTPAPVVGQEIFGSIKPEQHGEFTYLKFKGARRPDSAGGTSQKDIDYIIMMLEELTLRRMSPDNPVARDNIPTVEDVDNPKVTLEDIFPEVKSITLDEPPF